MLCCWKKHVREWTWVTHKQLTRTGGSEATFWGVGIAQETMILVWKKFCDCWVSHAKSFRNWALHKLEVNCKFNGEGHVPCNPLRGNPQMSFHFVLVCEKLSPQMSSLKDKHFWDQLSQVVWLRVPRRLQLRCWLRLQSSEGLAGAGTSAPMCPPTSPRPSTPGLVAGRGRNASPQDTLGCLCVLRQRSASPREGTPRESKVESVSRD